MRFEDSSVEGDELRVRTSLGVEGRREPMQALSELEAAIVARIERKRDLLLERLATLVAFPTPNPPGGNEEPAQQWLAAQMRGLGMEVELFDVLPGRSNVVGRLDGVGGGRSLLLNGHIDVAELRKAEAWGSEPFKAAIVEGRVYGLGTSDMKGAHAGFLTALEAVHEEGVILQGNVTYESVVGEETGERGTRACIERGVRADFAIVGEASKASGIVVTGVGLVTGRVVVEDTTTHHVIERAQGREAGEDRASNCIEKAATVILPALRRLEAEWCKRKRHPRLPDGSALINCFALEGGGNPATLPEACQLYFTVLYLPNEGLRTVMREVESAIAKASAGDPWLRRRPPRVEWRPDRYPLEFPPMDGEPAEEGVATLAGAIGDVLGEKARVGGRVAINDAGWLTRAGIPTAVYGPGDKGVIHQPNEYVEVKELVAYSKVLAAFIVRWCGVATPNER